MGRERYGEGLGAGTAVALVKEKGIGDNSHPFWAWLQQEGFHAWRHHGNFGMDWVFINLNSMIYAPGMLGMGLAFPIRNHAISAEEFKIIWAIYEKYEGLSNLKMKE